MKCCTGLLILLVSCSAFGQVYKCVDENDGKITYQHFQCKTQGEEVLIRPSSSRSEGLRDGERDLLKETRQGRALDEAIDRMEWIKAQQEHRIETVRSRREVRTFTSK